MVFLCQENPWNSRRRVGGLFLIQAARFSVLPIDIRSAERFNSEIAGRPELVKGTSQTLYTGMKRLSENSVINLKNKSFTVTAAITVPEAGAEGVLIAQGGSYGGWSFYAHEGGLRFAYNILGIKADVVSGDVTLGAGTHEVRAHFAYAGGGVGKGGTVSLYDGEHLVAESEIDRTLPFMYSMDETVDIGQDVASPVSPDYGPRGNGFTGDIGWVRLDAGDDDHSHHADPDHLMKIAMTRQ